MQSCYSNYKQVKSVIKCADCEDIEGCINETKKRVKAKIPPRVDNSIFCNCCMKHSTELKFIGIQEIKRRFAPRYDLYLYNCSCGTTLASKTKLNLG